MQTFKHFLSESKIPRYLHHFTQSKNLENIKQKGISLSQTGHVYMARPEKNEKPGPYKESPNTHHIIRVDTHHPTMKNHTIQKHPYYGTKDKHEYTTDKPIHPDALDFGK